MAKGHLQQHLSSPTVSKNQTNDDKQFLPPNTKHPQPPNNEQSEKYLGSLVYGVTVTRGLEVFSTSGKGLHILSW